VTFAAIATRTPAAFLLGTALAGCGFGPAFMGAYRTLVALAAPDERAVLIAAIFTVGYLAFSVPALIAGAATSRYGLHQDRPRLLRGDRRARRGGSGQLPVPPRRPGRQARTRRRSSRSAAGTVHRATVQPPDHACPLTPHRPRKGECAVSRTTLLNLSRWQFALTAGGTPASVRI
jgi:hypothetical protein